MLSDHDAHRALDAAMAAVTAARINGSSNDFGKLVRLGDCHGRLLGLLVHPAPTQPYYRGRRVPGAIVYLSDLTTNLEALSPAHKHSLGRIAQLFDLTRQESTLALLLAYGHTITEAAREMAIAEITARNYSKKVYAKMGVASQTDLVRLMLRSLSILL
jgi:DNA-binding CsgD family transcriptional regulator